MSYKKNLDINKYELVLLAKSLYDNVNEFVIDSSKLTSPVEIVKKIENHEFDLSSIKDINDKSNDVELNIDGLL